MPTSFLDLPREIRDQIYGYVLISPGGLVEPRIYPRLFPANKKSAPQFSLNTVPLSDSVTTESISLCLPRTCHQIYNETYGLFWRHNTFYFSTFYPFGTSMGVIKTLKMMGQTSSRLITSVTINMQYISGQYKTLGKVLQVLASRARHGAFRKLELEWRYSEFIMVPDYDGLLHGLNQGSEACKYERIIRLPDDEPGSETWRRHLDTVAKDLHSAFGGKLFWGKMLLWENYQRRGELPLRRARVHILTEESE
jgi:hypothetical protein